MPQENCPQRKFRLPMNGCHLQSFQQINFRAVILIISTKEMQPVYIFIKSLSYKFQRISVDSIEALLSADPKFCDIIIIFYKVSLEFVQFLYTTWFELGTVCS